MPQVVDVSTSKTGKHGHAKCNFVAVDIFTNKKYEDMCPSSHNCEVPTIKRADYLLLDISEDGFVSLMDEATGAPLPRCAWPLGPPNLPSLTCAAAPTLAIGRCRERRRAEIHSLDPAAGDTRDDLSLPKGTDELDKLAADLKAAFDEGKELRVSVTAAMGEEMIQALKTATDVTAS